MYRLGQSPYAGDFVLKGALMFAVWQGPYARSTRDIDLLGRIENSPERLIEAMQVVCQVEVAVDDSLRFQPDTISAEGLMDEAGRQGEPRRPVAAAFQAAWQSRLADLGPYNILSARIWLTSVSPLHVRSHHAPT